MTLVVQCRCGRQHDPRQHAVACAYCGTPTFDHHRVCAGCRPFEALEQIADVVIDVLDEIAPP